MNFIKPTEQELAALRADPLIFEQELDVRPEVAESLERAGGFRAGRAYWRGEQGHLYGLDLGDFVHTIGDAHIYTNHLEQVDEQLGREPFPLPRLEIDPELRDLDAIERGQIRLVGYRSNPSLRGEVAV